MYTVIMGHMGSDAAAANSIANIIKNLSICMCQGVASASGIMIGSLLGQGLIEKAKYCGSKLCRISLICGLISGGAILCVHSFCSVILKSFGDSTGLSACYACCKFVLRYRKSDEYDSYSRNFPIRRRHPIWI